MAPAFYLNLISRCFVNVTLVLVCLMIKVSKRTNLLRDWYYQVWQVIIYWTRFLILSPSSIFAVPTFSYHFSSQLLFELIKWNVLKFDQIWTHDNLQNFVIQPEPIFKLDAQARRWSLTKYFFDNFLNSSPRSRYSIERGIGIIRALGSRRVENLKLITPGSSSLEIFHENYCIQSFVTETHLKLSSSRTNQSRLKTWICL